MLTTPYTCHEIKFFSHETICSVIEVITKIIISSLKKSQTHLQNLFQHHAILDNIIHTH